MKTPQSDWIAFVASLSDEEIRQWLEDNLSQGDPIVQEELVALLVRDDFLDDLRDDPRIKALIEGK